MLDALNRLAMTLRKVRPLLYLIAAVTGVIAFGSLIAPSTFAGGVYLEPSIISCLWAILLFTFVNMFGRNNMTFSATANMSWWQRLKVSIRRFSMAIMALFFIGLSLVTLFVGGRLLGVWFGSA